VPVLHVRGERREFVKSHAEHRDVGAGAGTRPSLDALGVGDQDRELRVVDRVLELFLGPPGVERHGNGTDRENGGEGDDPFGVVAHGDPHPVAGLHAVSVNEGVTEGVGLLHHLGERPLLILIDNERLVQAPREVKELAKVLGRVLELSLAVTLVLDFDDFERLTGGADGRVGLFNTQTHATLLVVIES
jgi:hypothetical protein